MFLLLVLGCPEASFSPQIQNQLLDVWHYTEDPIDWIGAPSCGILYSDGTAAVVSADKQMGPVEWTAIGTNEFRLNAQGFRL